MSSIRSAKPRLRAYALSLPEAWLDHPWGEDVVKVGKKVFVFFGVRSALLAGRTFPQRPCRVLVAHLLRASRP